MQGSETARNVETPIVETRYGRLAGIREDGLCVFRGVPYAQPPTGDLRFRPPQAPHPWRRVRAATAFGAMAPQPRNTMGLASHPDGSLTGEDCLSLNIWTPATDRPTRPVLVWLHGGEFLSGTGAASLYSGEHLARRGNAVVVTLNYRLGALGFLSHPDLRCEETGAAGNWGLLDQLGALDWLADHVAHFGGDPSNVTLIGEGSGAASAAILMGTPSAQGLFQKAIVQGGHPALCSTEDAARAAELLCGELGLRPGDFGALRKIPSQAIVEAHQRCAMVRDARPPLFQPALDGGLLKKTPLDEIRDGISQGIPLLIGTGRADWRPFSLADPHACGLDEPELLRRLACELPGENGAGTPIAALAVETYTRARRTRAMGAAPAELWSAIQADRNVRIPALRFAECHQRTGSPIYSSLFSWSSAPANGGLDLCQGLEIPFAFGTWDRPELRDFLGRGGVARRLAARVQDAWLAFAHSGEPGHPDLPPWPIFDSRRRLTMIFDNPCVIQAAPLEDERRFWDDLGV